jgi:hypothetical protein
MESEKVDQRVPFVTRKSQLDAIDQWRTEQRPIPSRNEAIRQLVDAGLEAAREKRREAQS